MDELICNTHFVKPGYIYFTAEPCVISTVLGSCVAVVLYDRTRKLGGMNHFVYSTMGEEDKPTAFYAEPATVQLIRMFTQSGSNIKNV